jgi:hypothetical protein
MALHRDIFWVGRHWAVTGLGMQAVDQKQKSKFDIEIARLWDDDLLDGVSAERWFNLEDFNKGLAVARARYPEPPDKAKPPPREVVARVKESAPVQPSPPQPRSEPPRRLESRPLEPRRLEPRLLEIEPPKPAVAKFAMRAEGWGAKFTSMWRVRIRR